MSPFRPARRTVFARWLARTEKFWDRVVGRTIAARRLRSLQMESLEDRVVPAGMPAFAIGAGTGVAPDVTVYDGDGQTVRTIRAFDASFTGGVRTALADLNADGVLDLVAGAGSGGGPHVRVFDGATGGELGKRPADWFLGVRV